MAPVAVFILLAVLSGSGGQAPPDGPPEPELYSEETYHYCMDGFSSDAGLCESHANCTDGQICCQHANGKRCREQVLYDLVESLYVSPGGGAPRQLAEAIKNKFQSAATAIYVSVFMLDRDCAEVTVEIKLVGGSIADSTVNQILASLLETGIMVSNRLLTVTTQSCLAATSEYSVTWYVNGVGDDVDLVDLQEQITRVLMGVIREGISGWEVQLSQQAECVEVVFSANVTERERMFLAGLEKVIEDVDVGSGLSLTRSCRPATCTGDPDYCQNNGTCRYSVYYEEDLCRCPHPYSGDMCEFDACAMMQPDVCGAQGTCIGDLYMDWICQCNEGYSGIFCEKEGAENLTDCERQQRFNQYLLDAVKDELESPPPASFLNGKTVQQRLLDWGYLTIEVSKCWEDGSQRAGQYHSVCLFDVSDIHSKPDCFCTNEEGANNYWHYVDGDCRVYSGNPCDSDPCQPNQMCQPVGADHMCIDLNQCGEGRRFCPGPVRRCIPVEAMCDGVNDCKDSPVGSDEENCPADACSDNFCANGGTCRSVLNEDRSAYDYYCECPTGFVGDVCQDSVCQLMSNTEPVCGDSGTCVGNLRDGQLCRCSSGFRGAFCEEEGEEGPLKSCQLKQRLNEHARALLQDEVDLPRGGITANSLQDLLQLMNVDWLPLYECDRDRNFQLVFKALNVEDLVTTKRMCVSSGGEEEDGCESKVCSALAPIGICQNGGTCVGNIYRQLCDCTNTGHHGAVCSEAGESVMTECQRRRDLANVTIGVLSQTVDLGGFAEAGSAAVAAFIDNLLSEIGMSTVWMPECTDAGDYAGKGCEYRVDDLTEKRCFCVNRWEERRENTPTSTAGPPDCPREGMEACSLFDPDPCGPSGSCVGNIGRGLLCQCPDGHAGIFCDGPELEVPECVRRRNLTMYLLDVLHGFRPLPDGFLGSVPELRRMLGGRVEVPSCREDGSYQHICIYNVDELRPRWCYCTDENGAPENREGEGCEADIGRPLRPCNCSAGLQCLQGSRPGLTECACNPEEESDCRLPRWYCDGRANCSREETCVHEKECDGRDGDCQVMSKCISAAQAESHVCARQPCKHGGLCVAVKSESGDQDEERFYCQCQRGFGGKYCERNLDVCSLVPRSLCRHGCVGDVMSGVLCKCPTNRAGLECSHQGSTKCQQQQALFQDLMAVLKGDGTVTGFNEMEARRFAKVVMAAAQQRHLPLPNCTVDGQYAPVQCQEDVETMTERCFCVNAIGHPVSSNVMAYPGYPPCTAPFSPEVTAEVLCRQFAAVQICENGGTCVGNLLNGTMCDCPSTHTGIFCHQERTDDEPDHPASVCEFALEVYDLMRQEDNPTAGAAVPQYLQEIYHVLFRTDREQPLLLRPQCTEDGGFADVQCTYNLTTNQPVHCYCMGKRGIILSTMTNAPSEPSCDSVPECPPAPPCGIRCQHGLMHDMHGCQICRCREPCDGQCVHDRELRCVVETTEECGRQNWDGPCTAGVCRKRKKPGTCPVSVTASVTTLMAMMDGTADSCDVQCLDDADCSGDQKCCGLCGTECVTPVYEKECQSAQESAQQHLDFLRQLHQAFMDREIMWDSLPTFVISQLRRLGAATAIWVPACDANGYFERTQCMTRVTNRTAQTDMDDQGDMNDHDMSNADSEDQDDGPEDRGQGTEGREDMHTFDGCFCVDQFGQRVQGTEVSSDEAVECEVKPGVCPFLQPNSTESACSGDYDCQGSFKCCEDSLGFKVCMRPASPVRPAALSLDAILERICSISDICGPNGKCVNSWMTSGRICECREGFYGPLCKTSDPPAESRTVCREKRALLDYLTENDVGMRQMSQLLASIDIEAKHVVFQATSCDEEGVFEPLQCDLEMGGGRRRMCYCVDRRGRQFPGTVVEVNKARTLKCAAVHPCSVGTPLHLQNGSLVQCTAGNPECAPHHHCVAGRYGDLFCCRNQFDDIDRCDMPPIPGFDCPFYNDNRGGQGNNNEEDDKEDKDNQGQQNGPDKPNSNSGGQSEEDESAQDRPDTEQPGRGQGSGASSSSSSRSQERFFFNSATKQCEAFTYQGCSNAAINFKNRQSCEAKCLRGEHPGRCAAVEVPVREVCLDQCQEDDDCGEEEKCCGSPCGKQCVAALNDESEVCEIGEPLIDAETNEQKTCSDSDRCPEGYKCTEGACCRQRPQVPVCEQPKEPGPCEAYMPSYFFNTTSQRCEMFIYGGCQGNNNRFKSLKQCCNTCNVKGCCKKGLCPVPKGVLSSTCKSNCRGDGDCHGDQICCANSCGGSTCVLPKSARDEEYTCFKKLKEYYKQKRFAGSECFLKAKPRCERDGSWHEQQCNDKLGTCWCVTPKGNIIPGTRAYGVAPCKFVTEEAKRAADAEGSREGGEEADMSDHCKVREEAKRAAEQGHSSQGQESADGNDQCNVCPNGEQVHCCPEELCLQVCAADHSAVCRINPCGGCRAEFFNALNQTVNCTAGLTECQLERLAATRARHQHAIVALGASLPDMPEEDAETSARELQVDSFKDAAARECLLKPVSGYCRAYFPRWFFNATSKKCEVFIYGGCGGNGNNFKSPEDCYKRCKPEANPCAAVRCPRRCVLVYNDTCVHGQCNVAASCSDVPDGLEMRGVYVPECTTEGGFAYRQCQDNYCWCVDAMGDYTSGFTDQPESLRCFENGTAQSFHSPSCPSGSDLQSPNPECIRKCRDVTCPGHPFASCVVDLCSSNCNVRFVDKTFETVQCKENEEDVCRAQVFDTTDVRCKGKASCSGKKAPSVCGERNLCDNAPPCKANPCAVCIADPCNGQVYFKDRLTGKRYNPNQCDKLEHKLCEIKQCEIMMQNDEASDNATLRQTPVCDPDGSFSAKQRRADGKDVCVDYKGDPVAGADPQKACKKDPLRFMKVSVKYPVEYDPSKVGKIKEKGVQNVDKLGIPRKLLKSIEVRPGSTIVDYDFASAEDTDTTNLSDDIIDLAVVPVLFDNQIRTGGLNMEIDGQDYAAEEVSVQPTTASQVQPEVEEDDDDEGLDTQETIIVAVVCSVIGAGLLILIVYCCCCKGKKKKEETYSGSNTYDKPDTRARSQPPMSVSNNTYDMYDNVRPVAGGAADNRGYLDDSVDAHYVKVRM